MEVVTYWSGIAVGVLGSLYGFAVVAGAWRSAQPSEEPAGKGAEADRLPALWFLVAAAVLVLVSFLCTIPGRPPFAAGMRLGIGLLIGGAFGVAAGAVAPAIGAAFRQQSERAWIVAASAYLGLGSWALLGANLTLLLFRGYPNDALIGFGLGCCVAGLVLRIGGDVLNAERWRPLEAFVLTAVTLVAAVYIGVHHFALTEERIWWALPLLIASIGIAAAVVAMRFADVVAGRRRGLAMAIALLLAAALLAGLAYALSLKVFPPQTTFWVVMCGLGAVLAIVWLLAAVRPSASDSPRTLVAGSVQVACMCAVLIVLAVVVCFRLLAGYGIGLALVAAWAVGLVAVAPWVGEKKQGDPSEEPGAGVSVGLTPCLTVGLLVLLLRLFLERNPEAPRLELGIHYVFVGFVLGVLLPLLFAAFNLRTQERAARLLQHASPGAATRSVLLRTLCVAFFCAAVPLLVLFMWDFKAVLGLLAGLVAAQAILTVLYLWQGAMLSPQARDSGALILPGLGIVSVTVSLVAIQFSHLMAPLVVAERIYKLYAVGAILLLAAVWLLVDAWRSMRESRIAS